MRFLKYNNTAAGVVGWEEVPSNRRLVKNCVANAGTSKRDINQNKHSLCSA